MSVITRKHDRKMKQKRKHEVELKDVRERALKFHKGRGVLVDMDVSPQAELNALESYVENLQDLQRELEDKWGFIPEFKRSSWWVGFEISNALEQIVKLKIQLTKGEL